VSKAELSAEAIRWIVDGPSDDRASGRRGR
jgi:hypothetical protein